MWIIKIILTMKDTELQRSYMLQVLVIIYGGYIFFFNGAQSYDHIVCQEQCLRF
jgi:hypothetical protein